MFDLPKATLLIIYIDIPTYIHIYIYRYTYTCTHTHKTLFLCGFRRGLLVGLGFRVEAFEGSGLRGSFRVITPQHPHQKSERIRGEATNP